MKLAEGVGAALLVGLGAIHVGMITYAEFDECRPEPIGAGPNSFPHWVEVNDSIRSPHSRADKAHIAGADSLAERPGAKVRVKSEWRMAWRLRLTNRECTPPTEAPEDTTTTPDPEPPPDTTTAPADTTPAPIATGVSVAGYAAPDMTHPRDHGLVVHWDDNPEVDSWTVYGARDDGGEPWGDVEVAGPPYRHSLPADAEAFPRFACVVANIDGRPSSRQQCDKMNWAPMMRGQFTVTLMEGDVPLAAGEPAMFELHRVDRGWDDGSEPRPDSIVFTVEGRPRMDNINPYTFPSSTSGAVWTVPASDSVVVEWTVYPSPSGRMGGSVAYPVQ